jgi:hypothetical protein
VATTGQFSINGTLIANDTTISATIGDTLIIKGVNFMRLRGFDNFTFSYGSVSTENPLTYVVPAEFGNYTITLYDMYAPYLASPLFPSQPFWVQYFQVGNYLGAIQAYYTNIMGQAFWALFMFILWLALYVKCVVSHGFFSAAYG